MSDNMNNQELCILLDSILALLETDNIEKAKEVIKNGIKRIDKALAEYVAANPGMGKQTGVKSY